MERPRRACTSRKRPSHDVTDDGSGRSDCDASREVDPADASGSSASVNDSKGNLSGTSNALYKSVIERNKQIKNVQNSPSEHIPDEWQVYAKTIICTHGGKHRYRGKGKRPRQEVRPMGCTTQINAGVQVVSKSPVKFAVQLTRCGRLGQRLRVFWSSSWRTQTAAPLHKTDYWTFGRFVAIWVVYLWTCPTKRIATCITLQTKHMVDIFSRFPEGQYVQHAVIQNERSETLFSTTFPNVRVLLCQFHVVKYLREEVACSDYGFSSFQKSQRRAVVNLLVYAKTEREYEKHRRFMKHLICMESGQDVNTIWCEVVSVSGTESGVGSVGLDVTTDRGLGSVDIGVTTELATDPAADTMSTVSAHLFEEYFVKNWDKCRNLWCSYPSRAGHMASKFGKSWIDTQSKKPATRYGVQGRLAPSALGKVDSSTCSRTRRRILQCEAGLSCEDRQEGILTNPAPPPAAADSSKRKRVHTEETPTLIPNADQPQKSKGKKKRGQARDTAGSEAPRSAKQPKTGNKKARQTKKQLRELEDKRRRAMSSFGTIWAPPHHDGNDRPQEDVVIKPNPEHQTDLIRKVLVLIRKNLVTRAAYPSTSVGTPTSEETSTTPAAILFDQGVDLDPNLVVEDSSAFLDSDAEGSGDELTAQDEVSPDASSDESESDSDDDGWNELNIKSELERVKILLSAEEQEQLHLRVQESSPLYDNSQLADMAATGWAVRPVNSVVTIEDDVEVDSVYDGYCGPTPGSSACGLSPGALFYYSYRKRSGGTLQANQIATGGIRLKKLMRKSKQ
ncbi:hypothetical protein PC112_g8441 [Phytophthora cactorum]|nr:hypothetical protein PC112_g8441 [Phytophthora cactorum]